MTYQKSRQNSNIDRLKYHFVEEMEKIDVKDRRILYELDVDSRQSFRNIGRKVGLSKDVVASRVKKLKEKGIILRFFAYYDIHHLGYTFLRFYFKFQYVTPDYADLEIEINVRDISQLHDSIEELHAKFPKLIRNYSFFRGVKFYKWYSL